MKFISLAHITAALIIPFLSSCKNNHKPDLEEILSNSPDSTIGSQISKYLKLDSAHSMELREDLNFSRFFPTEWPPGSDSTLTLIATDGSVCTYFRESVYNYSCTWMENEREACDCTIDLYFPSMPPDTIDSFQDFQKYVKEHPSGIRYDSRIRGFTEPQSEVTFEDGEKAAFKIRINVFRPEPENWEIRMIRCPQSEWLIETHSVVFNAATAALVRCIRKQAFPSPEEKDSLRNYYLADLIDYRSKNFKHLMPGQREFLNWLSSE